MKQQFETERLDEAEPGSLQPHTIYILPLVCVVSVHLQHQNTQQSLNSDKNNFGGTLILPTYYYYKKNLNKIYKIAKLLKMILRANEELQYRAWI